jgi:hypothetical protein
MTSSASFLLLILGAITLSAGFALGKPLLLNIAWPILGLAFAIFIISSLISVVASPIRNATRTGICFALIALGCAVVIGILLTHGLANGSSLPYANLVTAHLSLSLGGWVLLLIIAMSYQVVPMFQLTPNYSKQVSAGLAPSIFAILLLGTVPLVLDGHPSWWQHLQLVLFWLLAFSFSLYTLWLQGKRRRRIADNTLNFFRLAMVALIISGMLSISSDFLHTYGYLSTLSAAVFILGFAMSVIHGMIYKIVPFLVWFHLFRGGMKKEIPNMKDIIPDHLMSLHFWLHAATLLFAVLSPWWNTAAWIFSGGIVFQGILLFHNLFVATTVYRKTSMRIRERPQ